MAVSLSPLQFKQATHTPPPSNLLLHHSAAPRQFRTDVHDSMLDNETVEPDHDPLMLTQSSSNPEHVTRKAVDTLIPTSRRGTDLPSWTPLKTSRDEKSLVILDNEVDELSTGNRILVRPPIIRQLPTRDPLTPTNDRATVDTTAATTGILKRKPSFIDTESTFKGKKARFDGVLITTKPPSYRKHNVRPEPASSSVSSSRMRQLSLVDALARTFDANKHTETPPARTAFDRHDDGSMTPGPHTDAETTEAEDEQLQFNTRLAHSPLKGPYLRTRAIVSEDVSENNSEDAASLLPQRDVERPVKRLKPISYDANAALVDAALGTVEAPIGWDAELDLTIIGEDDDFSLPMMPMQNGFAASRSTEEDVHMVVDQDTSLIAGNMSPPLSIAVAANERHAPIRIPPRQRRELLPYLSRGAKFIQRLDAIYGEDATVRTDRVARPRPVDLDFYAPFDELEDRESSPGASESTASVSAASALEEGASAVPSVHITSQSLSDVASADIVADYVDLEPLSRNQLGGVAIDITQPSFQTSEETIGSWIVTLQRLIKGKIRIKEEDLEAVSIILAEIESIKDNLGESVSLTSELRESVKQLSELHEIPFGDRNKLRQRAEVLFHAWSFTKKLGAS